MHPSYMSLQFPLLFIYGEDGYSKDLKLTGSVGSSATDKRISMKAYYAYYLHDCANRYNYLSRTRRLFQQYVVTTFYAIEQNMIDFISEHQNNIRNEYLSGSMMLLLEETTMAPTAVQAFYAHINVEYCGWTMLIKYMFKYISKGTDRVVAHISRNTANTLVSTSRPQVVVDEIKNFLDVRYIIPHEACLMIFEFEIHYRELAIQILSVHLKNMYHDVFKGRDRLESILVNPHSESTTLTEWLDYNDRHNDGRHLTYLNFPSEFVWHPDGCRSFPGIRIVNDIVYPMCRAACKALGILEDDHE
ncbi:hypothetical protein Tco_0167353 [Tanacetum coccineum]